MLSLRQVAAAGLAIHALTTSCDAAWTITPRNAITIDTAAVPGMAELSGVAYRDFAGDAAHQFVAVQDSGAQLVTLSLSINADGSVASAAAIATKSLSPSQDFEGVAIGPAGSIILAEESTPRIRRYDEATGAFMSSLIMPTVFSSDRNNFAFESLTRAVDGETYWTANEGALSTDGSLADTAQGTTIRLQKFSYTSAGVLTIGPQFAYQVDPIHTGSSSGPQARSGLSDLVALPDGSLLALERSLGLIGGFFPDYQTRIYRVTFDGATDVSVAPFDAGLSGQSYAPATKTLLWSGQAAGNLEGLALGPVLPDGSWSLIGVVDNSGGGDPLSGNTVKAFTLTPPLLGDYNFDGQVDAADYVVFRKGLSGDGGSHYNLWRTQFGKSSAGMRQRTVIPEPSPALTLLIVATLVPLVRPTQRFAR